MPFDPRIVRPAPITFPISPYRDETYWGFLNRLALANHFEHGVPLHKVIRDSGLTRAEAIGAMLDRPALHVALAMPTVQHNLNDERLHGRPAKLGRFACRRCAFRRAGSNVFVYAHQWDVICHRHQRWLIGAQFDITGIGGLTNAQRHHRALTGWYGHAATFEAWEAAQGVLTAYSRSGKPMPPAAQDAYATFTRQYADRQHDGHAFNAATYPIAVQLAATLLDPSRVDADGPGNSQKMTALIREWVPLLGPRHDMVWRDPLRVTLRRYPLVASPSQEYVT